MVVWPWIVSRRYSCDRLKRTNKAKVIGVGLLEWKGRPTGVEPNSSHDLSRDETQNVALLQVTFHVSRTFLTVII